MRTLNDAKSVPGFSAEHQKIVIFLFFIMSPARVACQSSSKMRHTGKNHERINLTIIMSYISAKKRLNNMFNPNSAGLFEFSLIAWGHNVPTPSRSPINTLKTQFF